MRVHGAAAAQRDGVRRGDAACDVELAARARKVGRGHGRRRAVQLLRDRAPGDVGVGGAHVVAERDRQRDGENHLDLLLMRAVGVVDRFAQAGGECVGARVPAGAASCPDVQRAGARPLRGEEVVRLRDHRVGRAGAASDPDLQGRVKGGLVGQLLHLVALPLHRPGEQDQRRGSDQRDEPDGDDDQHLSRLAAAAHQYSSLSTDCESKVMALGMPSSVLRTGFHWSFRSTTTS